MARFVKVGTRAQFLDRRGKAVRVGDEKVAVFRVGDRWFALQDECPHMGASLADGKLDGGSVVCRWHDWKFELDSGQGDQRKWACARVHEVRIEGEDVLVEDLGPRPVRDAPRPAAADEEWIRWDPDRFFKKK